MRRIMALRLVAAGIALGPGSLGPADAAPSAGADCRALAGAHGAGGVWWGRFSGGKHQVGGTRNEALVFNTEEACFPQRAECERWLYALKSEWQYMPRWNECRRGYDPGAPIPR